MNTAFTLLLFISALATNTPNPLLTDGQIKKVLQIENGDMILFGTANPVNHLASHDIFLTKQDSNGNLVWEKRYGGSNTEEGHDMIPTGDGGYLLLGSTTSFGNGKNDVWVIQVNESGDVLWEKTYGGHFNEFGKDILINDEGYTLKCRRQICPDENASDDCYIGTWEFVIDCSGKVIE